MSYLEEFRAAIKAGVSDDEKNAILARAVEDLGGRLEALTRKVAPPDYPLLLALLRVTVQSYEQHLPPHGLMLAALLQMKIGNVTIVMPDIGKRQEGRE